MSILNDINNTNRCYTCIKIKITDIIDELNYHIKDIIGNKNEFIIIENNNNKNLGLLFTKELLVNASSNINEITFYNLIYPDYTDEIKQINISKNLLISMSIKEDNHKFFNIWNVNLNNFNITHNDNNNQQSIDNIKNKFEFIKLIDIHFHHIINFCITKCQKYLICICLDNTIQKLNINTEQLEIIHQLDNWIFYYLPVYFINEKYLILCDLYPKVINLNNGESFYIRNDKKQIKNIGNENENNNNENNFSQKYIKKIINCHQNKYLFILYFNDTLEQYNINTFELLSIYNFKKENFDQNINDNIYVEYNKLFNFYRIINNYSFLNNIIKSFHYNKLFIVNYDNILISNNQIIDTYDNEQYLMLYTNNYLLKIKNKQCSLSYKTINIFPVKTKIIIKTFLLSLNRNNIYIPPEIVFHILKFVKLENFLN